MPETLSSAFEKLETELNKSRQELQRAESAKQNAWSEVQDARLKATEQIATIKKQVEEETARLNKTLPALKEQESALIASLDLKSRQLEQVKQETDLLISMAQQKARQAEADTRKAVDEQQMKLAAIGKRYGEFLKALPEAL